MFFAHLPAAYLINEGLEKVTHRSIPREGRWAAYLGAITPDLDLAYFYLVDHKQHMHHLYFTHWPSFWMAAAIVILPWCWTRPDHRWRWVGGLFFLNGFVHLMLDSVTGGIFWGAPWSAHLDALFPPPMRYPGLYLNFFLYWTILIEVAITVAAGIVFWHRHRQKHSTCDASS